MDGLNRVLAACLALLTLASSGAAQEAPAGLGNEVRTIFANHCAACHTPESNSFAGVEYKGDLDSILDFEGLRTGFYLDLDKPQESELYRLVARGEMPHESAVQSGYSRRLKAGEIATILAWIRAGAPGGIEEQAASALPAPPAERRLGEEAFFASCTACHPASRALGRNKDLSGWRSTVTRMSKKPGALVGEGEIESIAAYLTWESASRAVESESDATSLDGIFEALSLHATVSAAWRDSGRDAQVENNGFVAETWVTADWHPNNSPFSARVSACTTCHRSTESEGRSVEIVEAAFSLDLNQALSAGDTPLNVSIDAGRFVVPFGAFASQSNPAAYRTVSRPLLYSMGQMVERDMLGSAILPMPYSDEGVLVNVASAMSGELSAAFDAYVVNGLQGTLDVDFSQSRSFTDNNGDPALGGRLVVGTPHVSVGASAMTGRLENGTGALAGRLGYRLFGFDMNARIGKRLRILAEYAQRKNDQVTFIPANPRGETTISGYVVEVDFLLHEESGASLIGRFDTMHHDGTNPPVTSSLGPDFRAKRFTWGFDFALFSGSSLLINHEHWSLPDGLDSVDVLGARWVVSF